MGRSNLEPLSVVERYEGLRVSDALDAMQAIGLQDTGLMDHSIRPLWRDYSEKAVHRICGVAVTFQYFPTNRGHPSQLPYREFREWHSDWYRTIAPERFTEAIQPGTIVVIDAHDIEDTGFVGSNNALRWRSLGMVGVVTNGCCRDTDELILEKVPVYSRCQGGGTRPGRVEAGEVNQPVSVGGVLTYPGDVIVADGDGVVVVPREHLEEVAEIAWDIAEMDKEGRKRLYEKMNMPLDDTIK